MAIAPDPFYGCLCLETNHNTQGNPVPLPIVNARLQPGYFLPEMHFNIWEKINGTDPFLDIGVMLGCNDPAKYIEIFLPWKLEVTNIEDLAPRVIARHGIEAIFNEAWTSSTSNNGSGGYVTRTDGTVFTVVPYQPVVNQHAHPQGLLHSIVLDIDQLRSSSSATSVTSSIAPTQMYVRIRIKKVPVSFYQVGIHQGDALGGGFRNRTDIIDFRLNVRRGVPPGIETHLHGRFLEFSKVHLFLMKSRDQDIVFEDKLFQACRSLEDEKFWAEYILPHQSPFNVIEKSIKQVKGSLGYQWRKKNGGSLATVREFGMLARFKSFKMQRKTVLLFLLSALVLGALGNGLYDLACFEYKYYSQNEK